MYPNLSTNYADAIQMAIASNPTFKAICQLNIDHFPSNGYSLYYRQLQNGTAILQTHEQLNAYLASYADMHRYKLEEAFDALFADGSLHGKSVEIIDWGCGQAFASCAMVDYIREHNIPLDICKFHLIEPSMPALIRGKEHIEAIYQRIPPPEIILLNDRADELSDSSLQTAPTAVKIHLFSNVLDISNINLPTVANIIRKSQRSTNYFVCLGPNNLGSSKLKIFNGLFPDASLLSLSKEPLCGRFSGQARCDEYLTASQGFSTFSKRIFKNF